MDINKEYLIVLKRLNKDFQNGRIKVRLYRELWDRETEVYPQMLIEQTQRNSEYN